MKTVALRFLAVGIGLALLTSAYSRLHTASVMTESAKAFLASLTPEQRAQATFAMENDERLNWHYIPKERKGLPLRDMTPTQKQLAHALLAAGLSQRGYIKASTIMSLDEILKVMENGKGPQRDPEGYFFTIFGEPSETGTWGYRIEGHHVSQNFSISNGKAQDAPSFFGSNPAEVLDGPRKGLRILAREDDLGRELITVLDAGAEESRGRDEGSPQGHSDRGLAESRLEWPAQRTGSFEVECASARIASESAGRIRQQRARSDRADAPGTDQESGQ